MSTTRTINDIKSELEVAVNERNKFRAIANEGQGGYIDDTKIERLTSELRVAEESVCPLKRDLAGERAWFNAQGFTGKDLAAANKACLARGYSLADLQAACKASK